MVTARLTAQIYSFFHCSDQTQFSQRLFVLLYDHFLARVPSQKKGSIVSIQCASIRHQLIQILYDN
jgi:hypothetical protein